MISSVLEVIKQLPGRIPLSLITELLVLVGHAVGFIIGRGMSKYFVQLP